MFTCICNYFTAVKSQLFEWLLHTSSRICTTSHIQSSQYVLCTHSNYGIQNFKSCQDFQTKPSGCLTVFLRIPKSSGFIDYDMLCQFVWCAIVRLSWHGFSLLQQVHLNAWSSCESVSSSFVTQRPFNSVSLYIVLNCIV